MDNGLNINEKNSAGETGNKGISKKDKYIPKNTGFKQKECKVIAYNKRTGTLDVMFGNYGIRVNNVKGFPGSPSVGIKYKGEIGKPGFEYRL